MVHATIATMIATGIKNIGSAFHFRGFGVWGFMDFLRREEGLAKSAFACAIETMNVAASRPLFKGAAVRIGTWAPGIPVSHPLVLKTLARSLQSRSAKMVAARSLREASTFLKRMPSARAAIVADDTLARGERKTDAIADDAAPERAPSFTAGPTPEE